MSHQLKYPSVCNTATGQLFLIKNIRDNDLEEIITFNSVSMIVAEYIPFGANQMITMLVRQSGFKGVTFPILSMETRAARQWSLLLS